MTGSPNKRVPVSDSPSRASVRRCPICAAPASVLHRPFCSARCADVDLHRWLGGGYVLPGESVPDDEPGDEEPRDEHA